MKKLGTIFFISFLTCKIMGQVLGYSQNMFNLMYVNPGYAGSTDMFCIQPLVRQQWVGINGAPKSYILNINAPVNFFEKQHGLGLSVINDRQAYNNDYGIKLSYAYRSKVSIGDGMIGLGISLGLINSKVEFSKLQESLAGEPISQQEAPNNFPDIGLGVYYKTEKLYMGISGIHLIPPKYDVPNEIKDKGGLFFTPNFYVTAGYVYQLPNPMFEIVPSFFVQSIGSSTVLNLNTNLVYNNRVWGGVSFRDQGAVSGIFGVELMPGTRFGVSYDYETSGIGSVSNGTLEVIVLYCFKLKKEKVPQRYKSIRFL